MQKALSEVESHAANVGSHAFSPRRSWHVTLLPLHSTPAGPRLALADLQVINRVTAENGVVFLCARYPCTQQRWESCGGRLVLSEVGVPGLRRVVLHGRGACQPLPTHQALDRKLGDVGEVVFVVEHLHHPHGHLLCLGVSAVENSLLRVRSFCQNVVVDAIIHEENAAVGMLGLSESVDDHGLAVNAVNLHPVVLSQDAALDAPPPRRFILDPLTVLPRRLPKHRLAVALGVREDNPRDQRTQLRGHVAAPALEAERHAIEEARVVRGDDLARKRARGGLADAEHVPVPDPHALQRLSVARGGEGARRVASHDLLPAGRDLRLPCDEVTEGSHGRILLHVERDPLARDLNRQFHLQRHGLSGRCAARHEDQEHDGQRDANRGAKAANAFPSSVPVEPCGRSD
eukprot:CAMPEP_0180358254 /NCGR_PEP_ID=MMETSP0989-20121125/10425_1 /TAXON_ID=697907 /ORGANISM="non described non described, Strain CCMP2293" /LENGTH=402 /DNA_ID=CAMNT_0022348673 /DNA_START=162 /DNA_END=1368 /DNA_ORIENTATION=-